MSVTRILDTNVLLDSPLPDVIASYQSPCKIVIPFVVIKELDTFKNSTNDMLRSNSRIASHYLDSLRVIGKLSEGVTTEFGNIVKIESNYSDVTLPIKDGFSDVDFRLLKVAKGMKDNGEDVILVSQDTNVRIAADSLDLPVENFGEIIAASNLYKGWNTVYLREPDFSKFAAGDGVYPYEEMLNNEYALVRNVSNPSQTMLGKYDGLHLVKLNMTDPRVYNIKSKNMEQTFLLDALTDPAIKLVSCIGPGGSGKTLLALAAGLEQIFSSETYSKMLLTRSPVPMGKDIGFLPGKEADKMNPWMRAAFDNLEFLVSKQSSSKNGNRQGGKDALDDLLSLKKIDIQAMTFIRGRSIPGQYVLIDEIQNLSNHEVKTIVSRMGEGSKLILLGDIEQIDNPRLNVNNNGLVHLVDAFKGQDLYAHITLSKTERSELAELAVKLL